MSPRLPRGSAGVSSWHVAVTRPRELDPGAQSEPLAAELRKAGLVPVSCPVLKISPLESQELTLALKRFADPLARTVQSGSTGGASEVVRARWLLFSSRNAVWSLSRVFEGIGLRVREALDRGDIMVAAVGAGTAEAATEVGLSVALVPDRFDGDALLEALVAREGVGPTGRLDGVEVLFPRAEVARERLPEGLRRRGAAVHLVATYRIHEDARGLENLLRRVEEERLAAVTLTSGSAAQALGLKWGGRSWPSGVKMAAIGPVTARAAQDAGLPVDIVPERSRFADLATAVAEYLTRN